MASIIVALLGPDRPGLVQAVSECARRHEANWADSVMANLAGQFAGIVQLDVEDGRSGALLAALRKLDGPGLHLLAAEAPSATTARAATRRMDLDLVGHDRPGIIQTISGELSRHGVSIERLQTRIASGAMSGEPMFHLQARLAVPATLDEQALRLGLEGLANELMVDLGIAAGD